MKGWLETISLTVARWRAGENAKLQPTTSQRYWAPTLPPLAVLLRHDSIIISKMGIYGELNAILRVEEDDGIVKKLFPICRDWFWCFFFHHFVPFFSGNDFLINTKLFACCLLCV